MTLIMRHKSNGEGGDSHDPAAIDSLGERGADVLSPEFSEDQLAINFTNRHAENLRYVAPWGKWFQWTGTHWEHETTLAAFDMARKVCREAAAKCNKPSEAKAIAKAKTVASVEQLAKSDRAFVATIEQWDQDKALINTPAAEVHRCAVVALGQDLDGGRLGEVLKDLRGLALGKLCAVEIDAHLDATIGRA